MKIAIVYDMLYPFNIGGAEVRNYEIAKVLAKEHDVHLLGIKLWKGRRVIKREGIVYHGVCRYRNLHSFSGKRSIIEPIYYSIRLFFYLMKYKFDVVDVSAFPYFPAFSCKLYCMLKKVPLVVTWHEVWMKYWYEYLGSILGSFGEIIEEITSKLTKNVVAVSKHTKRRLERRGVSERNIKLVYNGVDVEKIDKIKPAKEKFDIIYAGRLLKHKNVDLFIKAVGLIKKKNAKIKAIIVGAGPELKRLKKLSVNLGLQDNIRFTGFLHELDKVYSYIKSSKVFVLPSELEGFGIVVIEAYACKKPVIVVNAPKNAAKDLVTEKTGYIVAKDSPSMAIAINKLLKKDLEKMGEEAYDYVKERFTWKLAAEKAISIYKDITK